MLHPSTQKLIDRLAAMTAQKKIDWIEKDNGDVLYSTEGYAVRLTPEPPHILLSTEAGKALEDASATVLNATPHAEGGTYGDLVAAIARDACREARGTEAAINTLLAGLSDDAAEPKTAEPEGTEEDTAEAAAAESEPDTEVTEAEAEASETDAETSEPVEAEAEAETQAEPVEEGEADETVLPVTGAAPDEIEDAGDDTTALQPEEIEAVEPESTNDTLEATDSDEDLVDVSVPETALVEPEEDEETAFAAADEASEDDDETASDTTPVSMAYETEEDDDDAEDVGGAVARLADEVNGIDIQAATVAPAEPAAEAEQDDAPATAEAEAETMPAFEAETDTEETEDAAEASASEAEETPSLSPSYAVPPMSYTPFGAEAPNELAPEAAAPAVDEAEAEAEIEAATPDFETPVEATSEEETASASDAGELSEPAPDVPAEDTQTYSPAPSWSTLGTETETPEASSAPETTPSEPPLAPVEAATAEEPADTEEPREETPVTAETETKADNVVRYVPFGAAGIEAVGAEASEDAPADAEVDSEIGAAATMMSMPSSPEPEAETEQGIETDTEFAMDDLPGETVLSDPQAEPTTEFTPSFAEPTQAAEEPSTTGFEPAAAPDETTAFAQTPEVSDEPAVAESPEPVQAEDAPVEETVASASLVEETPAAVTPEDETPLTYEETPAAAAASTEEAPAPEAPDAPAAEAPVEPAFSTPTPDAPTAESEPAQPRTLSLSGLSAGLGFGATATGFTPSSPKPAGTQQPSEAVTPGPVLIDATEDYPTDYGEESSSDIPDVTNLDNQPGSDNSYVEASVSDEDLDAVSPQEAPKEPEHALSHVDNDNREEEQTAEQDQAPARPKTRFNPWT